MKLKLTIVILALLFVTAQNAAADVTLTYAPPCLLPNNIVGCPDVGDSIANYLVRLYNFALGIIGTIAFGAIVYGGILIAFSGVADKKKEGREWITNALWGIVILLGSWLILNTINPEIPKLKEPGLINLKEAGILNTSDLNLTMPSLEEIADDPRFILCRPEQSGQLENCVSENTWLFAIFNTKENKIESYQCKGTNQAFPKYAGDPDKEEYWKIWRACQPTTIDIAERNKGLMCNFFSDGDANFKAKCVTASCENCQPITGELTIKSNASCSKEQNGKMTNCVCTWSVSRKTEPAACSINETLKNRLLTVQQKITQGNLGVDFVITEAWPPTVFHESQDHFNGKAIDIAITGANCAKVKTFLKTAKESGFPSGKMLIEYQRETLRAANPSVETDCGSSNIEGVRYYIGAANTGGHIHLGL